MIIFVRYIIIINWFCLVFLYLFLSQLMPRSCQIYEFNTVYICLYYCNSDYWDVTLCNLRVLQWLCVVTRRQNIITLMLKLGVRALYCTPCSATHSHHLCVYSISFTCLFYIIAWYGLWLLLFHQPTLMHTFFIH